MIRFLDLTDREYDLLCAGMEARYNEVLATSAMDPSPHNEALLHIYRALLRKLHEGGQR